MQGGGVNLTMNNNPNTPTRLKSFFSGENYDDDTNPVVILPRHVFLILVALCLMQTAVLLYLIRHPELLENQSVPAVIKVDGGCTIEANAITVKGTANSYRILPVDSPPPKH